MTNEPISISDVIAKTGSPLAKVARGQKWVIYAILLNLAAIPLRFIVGDASVVINLAAGILSIAGVIFLATGLGKSLGMKIFLIILMFIPLINLITLLVLNSWATTELRANGHSVGLLGARDKVV